MNHGEGLTGGNFSPDAVRAMVEFDGDLVVGGVFGAHVARWNGSAWRPLGALGGACDDLVVFNGELIAAGWFVFDQGLRHFARWDKSLW